MVKFWSYSLFSSIHSNPRVNSTLWAKDRLWLLAVSLVFSQPPDEAIQLATHVQGIYGHASLHRKNEEAASFCASMLAIPIVVVTARIEMYLFFKSYTTKTKLLFQLSI